MRVFTNGNDYVIAETEDDAMKVYIEVYGDVEEDDDMTFIECNPKDMFSIVTDCSCIPVGAKGEKINRNEVRWVATFRQWATIGRGYLAGPV